MTAPRPYRSIVARLAMLTPMPVPAIAYRPPELVGPPVVDLRGGCPFQIESPGGKGSGAEAPVAALRPGAIVTRGAMSFTTGGSGTANALIADRRRRAGLQAEPRTFDVTGKARPEVFAQPGGKPTDRAAYEQLPLQSSSPDYGHYVLVAAQAISATAGRITSVEFTLPRPPVATPRVRVLFATRAQHSLCPPSQSLAVYAPAMTADRIRRLFAASGCNWYDLAQCRRDDWPRGMVLFVQRRGSEHVYRWIDYDALMRSPPSR